MCSKQVVLHPWSDQFVKNEPMVLGGFNVATVKMNLISRTDLPGTNERRLRDSDVFKPAEPLVLKTQTLEMPLVAKMPKSDGFEGPVFTTINTAAPTTSATAAFVPDDPRGYNELLDTFSLHQFIIRRGETLSTTPEFLSFKRKYGAVWGRVQVRTYFIILLFEEGVLLSLKSNCFSGRH